MKFFDQGAQVRVINGKYEGETGLVVKTNADKGTLVLYSDTTNKQMDVFSTDVISIHGASTGYGSMQGWSLQDLVKLRYC